MVKHTKKKQVRPPAQRNVQRNAADWEEAALAAIAAHGLRALAIPELARSLGVTKGSFYWHFRGIGELVEAAMRRWEEMDRVSLDELKEISDPRARLTALFVQAMEKQQAHALYVALSAIPDVAPSIRRITDRRLQFLLDAYRELGLARLEAREQALLAYTAYVGSMHLRQQASPGLSAEKDLRAFVAHAVKTLIPNASSPRARPRTGSR
jgi:AcrR family transcriptional regulator